MHIPIASHASIQFVDVTEPSGIINNGNSWGASWGDFNSDGFPDLWLSNHFSSPSLYYNNGNSTFLDISSKLQLNIFEGIDKHGASWADFDNDGDQDLIILTGANKGLGKIPNIFLINDNGTLTDKSNLFGLEYSMGRGRTPLWFDWDGDGKLDLLLSNGQRSDRQASTALMHQTSAGFEDKTEISGLKIRGAVGAAQVSDLSGDRKIDLVIMTPTTIGKGVFDFSNFNFINLNKDLNIPILRAKDFTIADFNGDLLPDIYLTGINETTSNTGKLLINTGNGFIDGTIDSELSNSEYCQNVVAGDFDNDMDLDIYLVCNKGSNNLPNILYENQGNGKFLEVKNMGAEGPKEGLGDSVTTVDYNNDGLLDLFLTNGYDLFPNSELGSSKLFKNISNENHWIEIDLIGTRSNRDSIGSLVILTTGNVTQLREQSGGMHWTSQNHKRIHFGLGNNTMVNSILVYFPSGIISGIKDISSNQIITIVEPKLSISPRAQVLFGINPDQVHCNHSLIIIKKISNAVACVENTTKDKLIKRGWAKGDLLE